MSKAKREEHRRMQELAQSAQEISCLQSSLSDAYSHFNRTTDSGAMDACIFEISALRARYNSAVKHYRERYY